MEIGSKIKSAMMRSLMIALSLIVYAITQFIFWAFAKGPEATACTVIFKYVLLPLAVILLAGFAGKNNWWGKAKWALVAVWALLFLLVPAVTYASHETEAFRTFQFPNFRYLIVGCAVSLAGLLIGGGIRSRATKEEP